MVFGMVYELKASVNTITVALKKKRKKKSVFECVCILVCIRSNARYL